MRRIIFVIYALFGFLSIANGQEIGLSFYPQQKVDSKEWGSHKNIVVNGKLMTLMQLNDGQQELTVRSVKDMAIIKKRVILGSKQTTSQTLSNNFGFVNLVLVKSRVYLLVQSFDKSRNQTVLLAQELNDEGDYIGSLKEVDNIQIERESNKSGFSCIVSADSTKLLVISSPPYEKNKKDQFIFKTLDDGLKSLSKVGIELPQADKDFSFQKAMLCHNGSIVFLGYYEVEKRDVAKDFELQRTVAYIIEPSGTYKDFEITIPKLELINVGVVLSNDGKSLWVNGMYRDNANGKENERHGIVNVKIDIETKEIVSKKIEPFGKDIIAKANDKSVDKIKAGDGISYRFKAFEHLLNDDGTMWLLLEKRFATHDKYGSIYYFESIIALHLDNQGAILSSIFIPKRQTMGSLSSPIGSYYTCHDGKRLYLFMNDHKDNATATAQSEKDVKIHGNGQNSSFYALELHKDGTYNKIFLCENDGRICLPTFYVKIDDNNLIFEVRKLGGMMRMPNYEEIGYCVVKIL